MESDFGIALEERRRSAILSEALPTDSQTSQDPSPRLRHLLPEEHGNGVSSQGMMRSGSNGSESDATRLSIKDRWWDVVREVKRGASYVWNSKRMSSSQI
jgi:hypothetical protein